MPGPGPLRRLILFAVLGLFAFTACGRGADAGDEVAADATTTSEATPVPADGSDDGSDTDDGNSSDGNSSADENGDIDVLFPDVIAATADQAGDGTWTFSATLSSPYDTPERYADGWRVVGLDGTVYGTRPLAHDHQSEQPFTRSQSGIEIPDDITEVTVEGRDQLSGWGGATVQVTLER